MMRLLIQSLTVGGCLLLNACQDESADKGSRESLTSSRRNSRDKKVAVKELDKELPSAVLRGKTKVEEHKISRDTKDGIIADEFFPKISPEEKRDVIVKLKAGFKVAAINSLRQSTRCSPVVSKLLVEAIAEEAGIDPQK